MTIWTIAVVRQEIILRGLKGGGGGVLDGNKEKKIPRTG